MGIVDEDIQRVRDAADIVAVVSGHTQLRRVGTRWVGLCPFHQEKSGSFSVNSEQGLYYCFGCGAKGDTITFVREMEHVDFVGAVEWLAAKTNITLRYTDEFEGESRKQQKRRFELMDRAMDWYHDRLRTGADAGAARGYLRSRGFTREEVEHFKMGWAPDAWEELVRGLRISREDAEACGLGFVNKRNRLQDFFRARILFPIMDDQGRVVGFGGRKLPDAEGPKYQNSRDNELYHKSRALYGLNWAKADVVRAGEVVVCEGYTDVIGFHRAGVERAVATCGTALTEDHVKSLSRYTKRLVLAYDADEAGRNAAERVYAWEKQYGVEVAVVALPDGVDPDELARSDPERLQGAVESARPFLGFRLDRVLSQVDLSTPEGRARGAEAALPVLFEHPDPLVRDQYLMQVADLCRIDVALLRERGASVRAGGGSRPERPAGRPRPVGGSLDAAEVEALRLAVRHPEVVAEYLERFLFHHPIAAEAFDRLSTSPTFEQAMAESSPATADLLARLMVEEPAPLAAGPGEVEDVVTRLLLKDAHRVMVDLEREARSSADPLAYSRVVGWLKREVEALRDPPLGVEPARQLLAFLSEHRGTAAREG